MLALSDHTPSSRDWLAHGGSLSKVLSPGLRVGWIIAPPALLANATMCKQFSDAHTCHLTQAIEAHYLTLGKMDGTLNIARRTYAERARVMAESLRRELGVWAAEGFENDHPNFDLSESLRLDFLDPAKGSKTPEITTFFGVGFLPP